MPAPEKWFKPKRHSGFDKDLTIKENLKVMFHKLKLKYKEDRWKRVAAQAQALSNVTTDPETKRKASAVATQARIFAKLSPKK